MDTTEYKGKKLAYDDGATPSLMVDGEPFDVQRDAEANQCSSTVLPYQTFASFAELGRAIIDRHAEESEA